MPLIVLNVKLEKKHWIWHEEWLKGKWTAIKKTSMAAVARFWLENIFPGHFTPGNESRYGMQPRNKKYKRVKAMMGVGQGKYVDLILTGQSQRWLRGTARITSTSNRSTLFMTGPTYFSSPFIGRVKRELTTNDGQGKRIVEINIGKQPDKPKELTAINDQDRESLRKFFESDTRMRIKLAIASTP